MFGKAEYSFVQLITIKLNEPYSRHIILWVNLVSVLYVPSYPNWGQLSESVPCEISLIAETLGEGKLCEPEETISKVLVRLGLRGRRSSHILYLFACVSARSDCLARFCIIQWNWDHLHFWRSRHSPYDIYRFLIDMVPTVRGHTLR